MTTEKKEIENDDDTKPDFDEGDKISVEIKKVKKSFDELIDEDPERFFNMLETIKSWDEKKANEPTTCPVCGGWGPEWDKWEHMQAAHPDQLWSNHDELMKQRQQITGIMGGAMPMPHWGQPPPRKRWGRK